MAPLIFLQSVSDRVEKLQSSDDLISKLNVWPNSVIKKDWTKCVHQELFSGEHNSLVDLNLRWLLFNLRYDELKAL